MIRGVQIRAGVVYVYIIYICMYLASERSERDTIRGVQICAGVIYIYLLVMCS